MQTKRHPAAEFDRKLDRLSGSSHRPDTPKRPVTDPKNPKHPRSTVDSGLLRELKETPRHLD
jgi:hypothetical protein